MTLFHPDGGAIVLNPFLWRKALELARAHGWQPAGTLAPPIRWDGSGIRWNGEYDPPAGQEVTRSDARALAEALSRAVTSNADLSGALKELIAFCRQAGFLLCPAPEALDSLLCLAEGVGLGQPVHTRAANAPRSAA